MGEMKEKIIKEITIKEITIELVEDRSMLVCNRCVFDGSYEKCLSETFPCDDGYWRIKENGTTTD